MYGRHPTALTTACFAVNTSGYFLTLNSFSMIRTSNIRIRNQHASPLIKCPFRGCLRSFQSISGRTQHINAQHRDRDSSPQDNSGPDEPGDASCSPFVNDPDTDHYPNVSPPRTPSSPMQYAHMPSPTQPAGLRERSDPIIEDFDQPHTPYTLAPADPASSPIRSLLGSPFESIGSPFQSQPDFDLGEDQMRSPTLFRFDSPQSPQSDPGTEAGPNADQGSRLHRHQLHPVEHAHAQDHQNVGPTVKTFHTVIDGAAS